MTNQKIIFEDLGSMPYQQTWDYQEQLLQSNVQAKSANKTSVVREAHIQSITGTPGETTNHLLFVEHPPVFTLGKSGHLENLLIPEDGMKAQGIEFFNTNRGGDITFHGPGQLVVYPIFDLEHFGTDIGKYLRNLEEVVILTLDDYSIHGGRSAGETGVWIDAGVTGKARKIAALGVRCSRWITMHGFAFNVNTDLSYFDHIIPCGIQNKKVTSLEKESGRKIPMEEVKQKVRKYFEVVFGADLIFKTL
jgi:lipoyl(octanoyl) transferase